MTADSNASNLIYALSIPFACGVGVQRLVAILDAFDTWRKADAATRAWISAAISFAFGLLVVGLTDVRILKAIATATKGTLGGDHSALVDVIVSALIISAGTEGFNSIIKFLGYAKEQTKATAAAKTQAAKTQATRADNPNALKALHS